MERANELQICIHVIRCSHTCGFNLNVAKKNEEIMNAEMEIAFKLIMHERDLLYEQKHHSTTRFWLMS